MTEPSKDLYINFLVLLRTKTNVIYKFPCHLPSRVVCFSLWSLLGLHVRGPHFRFHPGSSWGHKTTDYQICEWGRGNFNFIQWKSNWEGDISAKTEKRWEWATWISEGRVKRGESWGSMKLPRNWGKIRKRGPLGLGILLILEMKRNQQQEVEKEQPMEENQENVSILKIKRKSFKLEKTMNWQKLLVSQEKWWLSIDH